MFISGVLFSLFGSIMRPGVDSGRGRKLRGAWGLDQPVFQESRSSSSGSATLKELMALIVPRRAIVGQLDPSRDALPPAFIRSGGGNVTEEVVPPLVEALNVGAEDFSPCGSLIHDAALRVGARKLVESTVGASLSDVLSVFAYDTWSS